MMRIAGLIALMLIAVAFASACSSSMTQGPPARQDSTYRMGPSGAPGELPPGVY